MDAKDFFPKPGLIIVGEGHSLTDKLQYFFNAPGPRASHGCNGTYPNGSEFDMGMLLTAEYNGVVHMLWEKFCNDLTYNFWAYEIRSATTAEIDYAVDYCEKEFLNDKYAYLSWPWFAYAALWRRVLNPIARFLHLPEYNIDKEHNWYFKDCFCTQQVWWLMKKVTELVPENWQALEKLLSKYFPDTFHPMQLRPMLEQNPEIFRLVAKRVDGVFSIM